MAAPECTVPQGDVAGNPTAGRTEPGHQKPPRALPQPSALLRCCQGHPYLLGWWELGSCRLGFSLGSSQADLSPALITRLGDQEVCLYKASLPARKARLQKVPRGDARPAEVAAGTTALCFAAGGVKYLSWCPTKSQPLPCSAKVEEERMVALHARQFVTDILIASRCGRISCLKLQLYSLFHTWLSALFAARYEIVITIWETSGFQPVSMGLMEGGSSLPGGKQPCQPPGGRKAPT